VRLAVLIIVLVAASFLGGAFVNGPGLQWAHNTVLRFLSLNNAEEIASIDLKPVANSGRSSDGLESGKLTANATQEPVAPMPAILTEDESNKHDVSDHSSTSLTEGKFSSGSSGSPGPQPSSSSSASRNRPLVRARSLSGDPASSDSDVISAGATSSSTFPSASSYSDPNVSPAILGTLSALLPSASPSSASYSPALASTSSPVASVLKSVANGADTWAVLERKLQSLGVSRYTMEGEPGGRVIFYCLIPLAGRQAVSQRFEAEGDDIVQAAQAALRRITLWQATQPAVQ